MYHNSWELIGKLVNPEISMSMFSCDEYPEVTITGGLCADRSGYNCIKKDGCPTIPKIKKVIFNDPATIVFFADGTKTIVKANNEPFSKEHGLAMAICKKVYGNSGSYFNVFKEWITEDDKK